MEDFENKMQIKMQDDIMQREIERTEQKDLLDVEISRWVKRFEDLKEEKSRYENVLTFTVEHQRYDRAN